MGNPFGIQHVNQPIVDIFNTWWSVRPENDIHKILLKITPSIICWEIWKQWCSCKFGGQRHFCYSKIIYQAFGLIKSVMMKYFKDLQDINHWPTLCLTIKKLRPFQKLHQVTWSFPQADCIKINTDSRYLHGSGKAGIGGIVWNSRGDMVMAFSISFRCSSSNMAEAL